MKGGKECAGCGNWSRILLDDLCQQCAAKYTKKHLQGKKKAL